MSFQPGTESLGHRSGGVACMMLLGYDCSSCEGLVLGTASNAGEIVSDNSGIGFASAWPEFFKSELRVGGP